jgi:hypothetical protein
MGDIINWGFFKRHFWGALLRYQHQARENRLVYVILAECRLILPEAQVPQPDHNVHRGAPQLGGTTSSAGREK